MGVCGAGAADGCGHPIGNPVHLIGNAVHAPPAIVQEGLSLRVTYVPGTGQHATVLDLLHQVDGVHTDYQRTTVDLAGNLIGPFEEGQTVKIRTDVGNSRDYSEMSPEQATVIAAAP